MFHGVKYELVVGYEDDWPGTYSARLRHGVTEAFVRAASMPDLFEKLGELFKDAPEAPGKGSGARPLPAMAPDGGG